MQADRCGEVDTHHYRVPWRLIGETVTVRVCDDRVEILRGGTPGARHVGASGRRQRVIDPAHRAGVVGMPGGADGTKPAVGTASPAAPALLRPLAAYEAVAGGGW